MTNRQVDRDGLDQLTYNDQGLIPVIAQSVQDGGVLMMAWANRAALELTLDTAEVHFWSRSRSSLWKKGESSGNTLGLISLHADCDSDTLLALVTPTGPACHTGEDTCFGELFDPGDAVPDPDPGAMRDFDATADSDSGSPSAPGHDSVATPGSTSRNQALTAESTLPAVFATLEARKRDRPEGSYTVRLLDDENLRIKKIGEEAAELIHALTRGEKGRAAEEAADLIYHTLAALLAEGVTLTDVLREMESRR